MAQHTILFKDKVQEYRFTYEIPISTTEPVGLLPSPTENHYEYFKARLAAKALCQYLEEVRRLALFSRSNIDLDALSLPALEARLSKIILLMDYLETRGFADAMPSYLVNEARAFYRDLEEAYFRRVLLPDGYVYFLREPGGLYKIGRSTEPQKRIRRLEIVLPYELEIALLIPHHNHRALETELHRYFASRRAQGEWFWLNASDLDSVRRRYLGQRAVHQPGTVRL